MGAVSSTVSCADRISLAKLYALTTKYRSDWPQLNDITNALHDLGVPKDAFVRPFAQFPDLQMPFVGLRNFCRQVDSRLEDLADKLADPSSALCLSVLSNYERRRVRDLFVATNPSAFAADVRNIKNAILKPDVDAEMTLQQWVLAIDETRRQLCASILDLAKNATPQEMAAQISPLEPKRLPCSSDINNYVTQLEDALASRGAQTLSDDEKLVLDLVKQYRRNQKPADVCEMVATLKEDGQIDSPGDCASQLNDCLQNALEDGERNLATLEEKQACELENVELKRKLDSLQETVNAFRAGNVEMV